MQALFDVGEEMAEYAGLGLLPGRVVRFAESLPIKVPHTGWNQIEVRNRPQLFNEIQSGSYVYFNHSYYCQAGSPSDVIAWTDYGMQYACAVQRDNITWRPVPPGKKPGRRVANPEELSGGIMSFTVLPAIDLRGGIVSV